MHEEQRSLDEIVDVIRWRRDVWKSNDTEVRVAERSKPSDPVPEEWTAMRQCRNPDQVHQEKP